MTTTRSRYPVTWRNRKVTFSHTTISLGQGYPKGIYSKPQVSDSVFFVFQAVFLNRQRRCSDSYCLPNEILAVIMKNPRKIMVATWNPLAILFHIFRMNHLPSYSPETQNEIQRQHFEIGATSGVLVYAMILALHL